MTNYWVRNKSEAYYNGWRAGYSGQSNWNPYEDSQTFEEYKKGWRDGGELFLKRERQQDEEYYKEVFEN